ncbi:MAG: LysM peptidoglycan-binding domain-containing protein [Planctomycetes bacterium]|nr:LysM peptidoglycan-binding domain-containing protein [Planctomycetota bacterium]MBU2457148.1 LysM peptidoglycan-binding domain-containing protein [Planctomycetota bacterium]MBU2596962.1 LysM peptidoglycan-binding domain-containing protein [Planctomycetota bacterium]
MTTDAKIGLLLALVFIVAITFVINGLPDFLSKKDKDQDTISYVSHYKPAAPGIVGQSRNIAVALNKKEVAPAFEEEIQPSPQIPAYQTILPAASEVVKSVFEPVPAQQTVVVETPAVQSSATIYKVSRGDSLAQIAQKFYGPQEGNRLVNIRKIYEANKRTLKSIDELQIGQKLIIPPLNAKQQALLKTGLFEKVDKEAVPAASLKEYVIKDQDTLWQIAAKYLGDPSRYEEIAAMNESIDTDNLIVGAKIKLPAR